MSSRLMRENRGRCSLIWRVTSTNREVPMPQQVNLGWRKSSYSGTNGNCVEVAWRTSSYSGGNGNCVEVAWPESRVAVRDSKNVTGPALDFPPVQWRGVLCGFGDLGAGRSPSAQRGR